MGERIRIGLFFNYDENWIGGVYYILNLIEALKLLPEDQQPELSIFYNDDKNRGVVEKINYPFIQFTELDHKMQFHKRLIRVFARKVFGLRLHSPSTRQTHSRNYYAAVFPSPLVFDRKISHKKIYWIPDFQEAWLPQFFSQQEIDKRRFVQQQIAKSRDHVIFSSYDAQKDFLRLYPASKVKKHVLQFATTHPEGYRDIDFSSLRAKYNLPDEFFFCPNQFWVHKNQMVVLHAIKKLRDSFDVKIIVIFSGKQFDQRNMEYPNSLQEYISENQLESQVRILGFIDRSEQLRIMSMAKAVIQPSLFEGWSTVVEDVKAMNQQIIASSLSVHQEQLGDHAFYFDPKDADSLARVILNFKPKPVEFHYEARRLKFAKEFMQIVQD